MAIFSNRVLQKIINENSKILTKEQLSHHVKALNRSDQETIDFEWEVVLLNAFSKIGYVSHEPDFGGPSRVDLHYKSLEKSLVEFIADIATVSDRGLAKQNRQEDFSQELNRLLRKFNLEPNRFFWDIAGNFDGKYGNRKMKLKLPEKANWSEIFDEIFIRFLQEIHSNPEKIHSFIKNTDTIACSVKYDPTQRFQGGHYPSYTVAYSPTKNPVYNALTRKSNQLKKSNFNGLKAIILCDGGCQLLNDTRRGVDNFNIDQVIDGFFRNNSSINFILTFAIEETQMSLMFQYGRQFRIVPRFIPNKYHLKSEIDSILKSIETLPNFLPPPTTTTNNAQLFIEYNGHNGRSFAGGMQMSRKRIKISSRALLELLSGQTCAENFFEIQHNFSANNTPENNLFRLRANEGCMFSKLWIEKNEQKDDDWIIFEFGDPDPAIAPFTMPNE